MSVDSPRRRKTIRALLLLAVPWFGALPTTRAEDTVVVVIGASGGETYESQFQQWAAEWEEIANQAGASIQFVGRDPSNGDDRERWKSLLDAAKADQESRLWMILIGHGTVTRGVAKFNLRGPDVSATELAQWISDLKRPLVLVNAASASGPFLEHLSGDNRVIVTATRSGSEQNFARFGKFFTRAIAAPESDLDHDDEVSVLEAFIRAGDDVRQFYESENRIATEHALIDDNGDRKGTPPTMFRSTRPVGTAADGTPLDGGVAARITLAPAAEKLALTPEELRTRDTLEDRLAEIRARKDELSEGDYDSQIEPLLIRLAEIYQAAEARSDTN